MKYSEIRAEFSSADKEAHRTIRNMLWAAFPRSETLDRPPDEDEFSDDLAAGFIHSLKRSSIALTHMSSDDRAKYADAIHRRLGILPENVDAEFGKRIDSLMLKYPGPKLS